jgi:hypothetical protein
MCRMGIVLRPRCFLLLIFISATSFGQVKQDWDVKNSLLELSGSDLEISLDSIVESGRNLKTVLQRKNAEKSDIFDTQKQYLNSEATVILEKFFQVFTKESELGYVLFGKKPVCIHGFSSKDSFRVDTSSHEQSVALKEGARIWRQLAAKNRDVIIHVCDKEDPLIPGYIHVLAINVPLFHEAVNENISLFQYVLGPATNSQDLLNALLSNTYGFHSLLKDDKVLVGKLLGFGIQNSLYVSRMENIQDAFERDMPPFLHCESLTQHYQHEYLPYAPSFGFQSIGEELNDFQKKIALSSEKLTNNHPEFFFVG